MIYDVKIYGPDGSLKEVKDGQKLADQVWVNIKTGKGTPYARQMARKKARKLEKEKKANAENKRREAETISHGHEKQGICEGGGLCSSNSNLGD